MKLDDRFRSLERTRVPERDSGGLPPTNLWSEIQRRATSTDAPPFRMRIPDRRGTGQRVAAAVVAAAVFLGAGALVWTAFRPAVQAHRITPSPSATTTNPVAPGFQPDAIAFWNPLHGLITGLEMCSGCEGSAPGGISAATDDGGRAWRVVDRTTPTTGVATFGADDAWVMTATGVLHTADGGHTWNKISSANLIDPSFSSPLDGWAAVRVSDVHYLLEETSDGGRTWQKIPSPCHRALTGLPPSQLSPKVIFLFDLSNTAPGQGSVFCSNGGTMGGVAQGVLSTQDHGVTWTQRWAGYNNLYGMQILPDGYGGRWDLISGGYETTTDGGNTWTTVGKFTDPATDSAWLLSDSSAFALTGSGHGYSLVQTTDGGHTWRHVARFPSA